MPIPMYWAVLGLHWGYIGIMKTRWKRLLYIRYALKCSFLERWAADAVKHRQKAQARYAPSSIRPSQAVVVRGADVLQSLEMIPPQSKEGSLVRLFSKVPTVIPFNSEMAIPSSVLGFAQYTVWV